jgi:hypothetical protein
VSFEKTRVAIRVWRDGARVLETRLDLSEAELEEFFPQLAREHVQAVGDAPHMIEIEFLDEADQLQRFFRFGTDPRGMARPLRVDLRKIPEVN